MAVVGDGAREREERGRERREGVKKREAQGRKSGRGQGVREHICTHTSSIDMYNNDVGKKSAINL